MEAYKKQIGDIFPRNKLLEIPFYQRSYVWGEDEWERLLEDLRDMCERGEEYFLGSVILKNTTVKGANQENFAGKFVVIDGQQRLTTLLIMMKVIALLDDDMETFDGYFVTKKKREGFEAISLRHNHKDRPDFERVLRLDAPAKLEPTSNIVAAYNYFLDHIDRELAGVMNLDRLTPLMSFVMITIDDGEDEQQIFDTINSLGVRLTTAELLKNYFFSSEDLELYESYWQNVFEKDDGARTYWDQVITTGRLKRPLVDVFFDSLLQILVEEKEIDVKDADKKAYEKVERLFHSYRDFIEIKHYRDKQYVLKAIKPFAELFMATFRPSDCDCVVSREASTQRINVIIFGLQTTTLIPYILYLRSRMQNDDETFNEMLGILEAFVMRRVVCRESSKNYNRFFNDLIRKQVVTPEELARELTDKRDTSTSFPEDTSLRNGFHEEWRLTSLQARGVLYLLETAQFPKESSTSMLGFRAYSLEHLMPKKWRNHWGHLNGPDEEKVRDKTLLTLGNLAVIPQPLNGSISDSPWTEKKAGNGRHQGLALCAGGLKSMVQPLAADTWDESGIYGRAETLFQYALETWGIGLTYPCDQGQHETRNATAIYWGDVRGAHAKGTATKGGGFIVLAGSVASEAVSPSLETYHPSSFKLRKQLCDNGVIVNNVFQKDWHFKSLTQAADVVVGYPYNGKRFWQTKE